MQGRSSNIEYHINHNAKCSPLVLGAIDEELPIVPTSVFEDQTSANYSTQGKLYKLDMGTASPRKAK